MWGGLWWHSWFTRVGDLKVLDLDSDQLAIVERNMGNSARTISRWSYKPHNALCTVERGAVMLKAM